MTVQTKVTYENGNFLFEVEHHNRGTAATVRYRWQGEGQPVSAELWVCDLAGMRAALNAFFRGCRVDNDTSDRP